jgi:hypothetical protein
MVQGVRQGSGKAFLIIRMHGLVGREEKIGRILGSAFEKLQGAPGVVDFFTRSPPIPNSLVARSQRELESPVVRLAERVVPRTLSHDIQIAGQVSRSNGNSQLQQTAGLLPTGTPSTKTFPESPLFTRFQPLYDLLCELSAMET